MSDWEKEADGGGWEEEADGGGWEEEADNAPAAAVSTRGGDEGGNPWAGEDEELGEETPQAPGDRFSSMSREQLCQMIRDLEKEYKNKGNKNRGKLKREAIKKREEEDRQRRIAEQDARLAEASMTAEEKTAKKLAERMRDEEADLELSKELFGGDLEKAEEETNQVVLIEAMEPVTKSDFAKFGAAIAKKVTKYENSPLYPTFLEELVRDVTLGVKAEVVRKASSSLTRIANEKVKQERGKKKPKSKKQTLAGGKGGASAIDDYSAFGGGGGGGGYDEFDFM
eukprot:UC1_evm4s351